MYSKANLDFNGIVQQALSFLKNSQSNNAIAYCLHSKKQHPNFLEINIILSQAYQQRGLFDDMLQAAQDAAALDTKHFTAQVRLIECLIYCSQVAKAIKLIDKVASQNATDPLKLARIAELYLHCSQHQKVENNHQAALSLQTHNPAFMYNLAAAKINLGKLDESESLLNKVIKITANDFDAYTTRSSLRTANKDKNNIVQLQQVLKNNSANKKAQIAIGFALAKEYEDMEDYDKSWTCLANATQARRQQMNYQVGNDVKAIDDIIGQITYEKLNENQSGFSNSSPIFIVGLPRSGTTLVDRILSGHEDVASLGEINSLAFSLIHSVGEHQGKQQLIEKSTCIDFEFMAKKYTLACRGYGFEEKHLIDKTPLNFLYLGLIKRAFPNAKIIHVVRNPMDSCYAMYKTLFRMGYPFSYDLDDLALYYCAYDKLMQHWRNQFPNSFFELKYENLVNDSETTTKSLLEYCQLEWNSSLLNMHLNQSPTATASAAQVRQKIYTSSVAKWKHYAKPLHNLYASLQKAGINCDSD